MGSTGSKLKVAMEALRKRAVDIVNSNHRTWMDQLDFFRQELKIFRERLEGIAQRDRNRERHVEIEQFQNRFIIQNYEIDRLKDMIRINEAQTFRSEEGYLPGKFARLNEEFEEIKNKMRQFQKLYKELIREYTVFLCAQKSI